LKSDGINDERCEGVDIVSAEKDVSFGKPLPKIKSEVDKPPHKPSKPSSSDSAPLTPKQESDFQKWLKSYSFLIVLIVSMSVVVVLDAVLSVFAPDVEVALIGSFFEVLRASLFAAMGYVFAKIKK